MELLQARVCSVINLAAILASPVSSKSFFSGNGNSFISTETSVKPAFRTGESSDMNGFVSSSCVLKYPGSVISFSSFCGRKTIMVKTIKNLILNRFFFLSINKGNRTEWSPIRSVIIRVINKIGRPRSGSPICQSRVWLQTELDDAKPCYQLIKTMTKIEKRTNHRLSAERLNVVINAEKHSSLLNKVHRNSARKMTRTVQLHRHDTYTVLLQCLITSMTRAVSN